MGAASVIVVGGIKENRGFLVKLLGHRLMTTMQEG
jgi:hypothetical protein